MKILKEEKNLLILEDKNFFQLLIGFIFFFFGILLILKPSFIKEGIKQENYFFNFLILIIGLLLIFFYKTVKIFIDKEQGKVFFYEYKFLNKAKKIVKIIEITQIKEVVLFLEKEREIVNQSNKKVLKDYYVYSLFFVLNNDLKELIFKTKKQVTFNFLKEETDLKNLAAKISNFLNIPFNFYDKTNLFF